jgi:hypothetical protein
MSAELSSLMESAAPHAFVALPAQPILAAIVYQNEAYPRAVFTEIVALGRARRATMAGVLQHPASTDPARRCDVALEDLMSGERTSLFEDRGRGARGCRLDLAALAHVAARIEQSFARDPTLLLVNKFGKAEAEGGGLLDIIAAAVDRDIPVIVGVPERNLEAWRNFAGSLAVEFGDDVSTIATWWAAALKMRGSRSRP